MTRRKSILGALVLCALSLCAFGAASASAEGLTAFTCTEAAGSIEYTTSHCDVEKAGGGFSTQPIPAGETTEVEGEAVLTGPGGGETRPTLTATVALVKISITCEGMTTKNGHLKNLLGPPMSVQGNKIELDYTGCMMHNAAGTVTCQIESVTGTPGVNGTIATKPLKSSTSFVAPSTHSVTFEPETVGDPFTKFKIIEAGVPACKSFVNEYTVTGSATGLVPTTKHSHITFEGTAGGKLKLGAATAEYMATHRVKMKGTNNTIGLKTS